MEIVDPTAFLAVARERRQLLMRSRCRIRRPAGERTFDPVTGEYDTPDETVVYEGICQIRPKSSASPAKRESNVGESEMTAESYEVFLPFDVPRVLNSDSVDITESDDAWLLERGPLVVGWVEYSDNRTHRSLIAFAQDFSEVNDA